MTIAVSQTMSESTGQDFGEFYEEWVDKVYNYALHRTGSAVRAEEIVSDTFTRSLSAWSSFDPERGARRSWLFGIALRAVADHYRDEKRRQLLSLGLWSRPPDNHSGPEQKEDESPLMDALAELKPQHREIVSLKFFGCMTNRAIAKLLGLTETNVGVTLYRCVRRLRKISPDKESDNG